MPVYFAFQSEKSKIPSFSFDNFFSNNNELQISLYNNLIFLTSKNTKGRLALLTHTELMALASITRLLKPKVIFEFGTYNGGSCYNFFINMPATSTIFSLDFVDREVASPLIKDMFLDSRVTKIISDSRHFDYRPYHNMVDLIFIDGDHRFEVVKEDSLNAFNMCSANGIIIWHDYIPDEKGVYKYLNELYLEKKLFHLKDTSLVLYRNSWNE